MTIINEARCERTELPASMCSHCRGLPWVAPAVDPELDPFSAPAPPAVGPGHPGPWFVSHYGDNCATCGGDIIPGDTIRADGLGGYECGDCGNKGGRQ